MSTHAEIQFCQGGTLGAQQDRMEFGWFKWSWCLDAESTVIQANAESNKVWYTIRSKHS
jgi:hypothetical protein